MLYKDMSTRDLMQRRATKKSHSKGDHGSLSRNGMVGYATDELGREESKIMSQNDTLAADLTESTNSDSMWEMSPLINAAIHGRVAILDNIDRLPVGALSVLQSLIHERHVYLLFVVPSVADIVADRPSDRPFSTMARVWCRQRRTPAIEMSTNSARMNLTYDWKFSIAVVELLI